MNARFVRFGEIEIDGEPYVKDVVVAHGEISTRSKKPSKPLRAQYGHTPLTAREAIPWDCQRLIIGTGTYGRLPVLDDVKMQAEERGVELVLAPTEQACELLSEADLSTTNAILHLTC